MTRSRVLQKGMAAWGAVLLSIANAGPVTPGSERIETGRLLAHDFSKGNCLACHSAPTDATAVTRADIAPPLIMIRERFPDRKALRSQIWDPTQRNPNTVMPPFGKHRILTDTEIDLIIDYLYTL